MAYRYSSLDITISTLRSCTTHRVVWDLGDINTPFVDRIWFLILCVTIQYCCSLHGTRLKGALRECNHDHSSSKLFKLRVYGFFLTIIQNLNEDTTYSSIFYGNQKADNDIYFCSFYFYHGLTVFSCHNIVGNTFNSTTNNVIETLQ